ncbi:right-handed parallel beta-helix repeat-containing protein [Paenibacillus sp. P36]|uniref:right-handed parallel beta-helix repeat-containing protein n=1 Tax=Paenibacillus sp. P36 TaxID=3342538 RepID=UPI0038B262AA
MPSTTTNLGLYKKNPSTDGNDTFDINMMLNDNWDRVDAQLGAQFADAAPTPVNLVNGLQVVDVPQTAPLENLRITGRTLVNLLGRDGNCEDVGRWGDYQSIHVLDSANKTLGNKGFKVTLAMGTYAATNYLIPGGLKAGKYYILVGDVKNGNSSIGSAVSWGGIDGRDLGSSPVVTNTSNFQTVYVTANPSVDKPNTTANLVVNGSIGQYGYFDAIRVYELSQTEYNAIGDMTSTQVAAKYPYVDNVKHVNAPYVIKYGENLLPPFNEWIIHANAIVNDPYKVTINATSAYQDCSFMFSVIPGQSYTISGVRTGGSHGFFNMRWLDVSKNLISDSGESGTAPLNAVYAVAQCNNDAAGTFTFSNVMLNLGSTAKAFTSRNDDMLAFPNVQLASSVDGTVYDTLFERNGRFYVEKRFKDMVLDGNLNWTFGSSFSGCKTVSLSLPNIGETFPNGVKHNGKILAKNVNAPDVMWADTNYKFLYLGIADADSGWGESYIPTSQEIQAYFNGWVMYDITTGNPVNKYNGTGNKGWCYRLNTYNSAPTESTMAGGTNILPTSPAPSTGAFTPYKLSYQLVTPTFEEIQVDGSMSLHKGLNQIEVSQGVIVREKVIPDIVSGTSVELNQISLSPLMKRTNRILSVYRNGKLDPTWQLSNNNTTDYWYGGGAATISSILNYDKTAAYEVSYVALDQHLFTSPVQAVTGEVASNFKVILDQLVINQADNDARIRANETLAYQIYSLPQKTAADITLHVDVTNGADNNDGSVGKPFKTINKAISVIPQMVNHTVRVNVATGTYAETAVLYGFNGSGVVQLVASGVVSLNAISIIRCQTTVVEGFTCTSTTGNGFYAEYGRMTIFNNCKTISVSSFAGFSIVSQNGQVLNCTISNKENAVAAQYGSSVLVSNCTGTSNNYVLVAADGANLTYSGSVPSGNIQFGTYNVGMINKGFVVNPWGDNTRDSRSRVAAASNTIQSLTASTATKILFQASGPDNLSEFISSRFTAKGSAGTYSFVGSLTFSSGMTTSLNYIVTMYKNGSPIRYLNVNNGTAASSPTIPFSAMIDLLAGDYVEFYITTSSATALAPGSALDITRIA